MPGPEVGRIDPSAVTADGSGARMLDLMRHTLHLPRSLTGDGVRHTLAAIARDVPVRVTEVPSGTPIADWTVPPEWRVREAHITGPDGVRVVDVAHNPLHLVGYSVPVREVMPLARLREHLHTLPQRPHAVPYRTAYWNPEWGFCMRHDDVRALPDGDYAVVVDTELDPHGSMTLGEIVIPGRTDGEVLISTPVCHPGLANDNLSGVALLAELGRVLTSLGPLRRTHRLLLSPGTVGPIAWLLANRERLPRIHGGLAVMCAGDPGALTYRCTKRGDTPVDRAAALVFGHAGEPTDIRPFLPWGGDERQYASPGFDLPIGAFTRTPPGEHPPNHTSDDDLTQVSAEALASSLGAVLGILQVMEEDARPVSRNPDGEPQLGRRGLTRRRGGEKGGQLEMALLWVMSFADGHHTLVDVAQRSGIAFPLVREAFDALLGAGLVTDPDASATA